MGDPKMKGGEGAEGMNIGEEAQGGEQSMGRSDWLVRNCLWTSSSVMLKMWEMCSIICW